MRAERICSHSSADSLYTYQCIPPFLRFITDTCLFIIRTVPEYWVPAHSTVKQTKKAVTAVVYAIIAFDYVLLVYHAKSNNTRQIECKQEKINEITACPQLLDKLKIRGAVITTDAMICQKEIVSKIIGKKNEYVLALKKNQPKMYEEVEDIFKCKEKKSIETYETFDKEH